MTKGGLDLKAYLIMPVQRLPRYEILLTVRRSSSFFLCNIYVCMYITSIHHYATYNM